MKSQRTKAPKRCAEVVAVSNQKGGVGKTTIALNLGKNLAARGYHILMIDGDPQANLSRALVGPNHPDLATTTANRGSGPGPSNVYALFIDDAQATPLTVDTHLHLLGSSKHLIEISTKPFDTVVGSFRDKLQTLRPHYDFILIDCLPSGGTLQAAAHSAADHLLIPIVLDDFAVSGLEEQLRMANNIKRVINPELEFLGIVINQVSSPSRRLVVERAFYEQLNTQYEGHVFHTQIGRSTKVSESHALQKSVAEYHPQAPVAHHFHDLTNEVLTKVGIHHG